MKLSAVIPTRGDVPIGRIIDHLMKYDAITEVIIAKGDTPYNRYRAAMQVRNGWVYTQDDDCITDIQPLLDTWRGLSPDLEIINAMTREHAEQYPGRQTLIGFGAIFSQRVVARSFVGFERDSLFFRESDRIFATVNPHITAYPKIEILPHAHNENRLWKQPDHLVARDMMNQRIFEVRGIRA